MLGQAFGDQREERARDRLVELLRPARVHGELPDALGVAREREGKRIPAECEERHAHVVAVGEAGGADAAGVELVEFVGVVGFALFAFGRLVEVVRIRTRQVQVVDGLERIDLVDGGLAEGRLALEGVQEDALEQLPQRNVERLGEGLRGLEDPALDPDAGLDSIDCYHVTKVPLMADSGATCSWP